jgi:hypothetical protein
VTKSGTNWYIGPASTVPGATIQYINKTSNHVVVGQASGVSSSYYYGSGVASAQVDPIARIRSYVNMNFDPGKIWPGDILPFECVGRPCMIPAAYVNGHNDVEVMFLTDGGVGTTRVASRDVTVHADYYVP